MYLRYHGFVVLGGNKPQSAFWLYNSTAPVAIVQLASYGVAVIAIDAMLVSIEQSFLLKSPSQTRTHHTGVQAVGCLVSFMGGCGPAYACGVIQPHRSCNCHLPQLKQAHKRPHTSDQEVDVGCVHFSGNHQHWVHMWVFLI
jgi:hypothetical protein